MSKNGSGVGVGYQREPTLAAAWASVSLRITHALIQATNNNDTQ
ncbi:hypothetical protein NOR51B_1728 [Luminiphilus syltensis NOR5-1B]|uniref:Uncharacterized protein n=1 Tax=Luminiphilus syltensis NOR5-1B TaxID=565045 RepID=B8KV26_9GAMM|nr:hypothetical protein NOR51B_1728 [Luminiphilus syltensis NOR5-1B]